ncbi:matrixin family metalloprotease [bacterium]|nr:matrixin family metalloprotease [bacterium]
MLRNFLAFIFLIVCGVYIWFYTPVSSDFYMNKGMSELNAKHYDSAVQAFERSLGANPSNFKSEYYLVQTLSEMEPTYTVQKKLYEISQNPINQYSKRLAQSTLMKVRNNLLKDLGDNYIYNAMQGKDVIRWDIKSFPLKVYIENEDSVPAYYVENLLKAMSTWEKKTGFVKFQKTNDKNGAQIRLVYRDIDPSECAGKSVCSYAIAYTEPVISSRNVLKYFDFVFHRTNPKGENYTADEVYTTSLHELGHTLGIMGHSDNSNDIMYDTHQQSNNLYSFIFSEKPSLSMRDLRTLALLYSLAPSISNVKNLSSEKFYYPPVIIGAESEALMKKIEELQGYIDKYPHMAAGYINISSVYSDLGDFDKALSYINMAARLANTDDEKYMISYNKAIIFFNNQDFDSARTSALKAQSIKDNSDVRELIEEIDKILNE